MKEQLTPLTKEAEQAKSVLSRELGIARDSLLKSTSSDLRRIEQTYEGLRTRYLFLRKRWRWAILMVLVMASIAIVSVFQAWVYANPITSTISLLTIVGIAPFVLTYWILGSFERKCQKNATLKFLTAQVNGKVCEINKSLYASQAITHALREVRSYITHGEQKEVFTVEFKLRFLDWFGPSWPWGYRLELDGGFYDSGGKWADGTGWEYKVTCTFYDSSGFDWSVLNHTRIF